MVESQIETLIENDENEFEESDGIKLEEFELEATDENA